MIPISVIPNGQVQAPTTTATWASGPTKFCQSASTLSLNLTDGVLFDKQGRTGYIAGNYQLQFDQPPQAGAIYTGGFSICNHNLTLGSSSIFWQCRSGNHYNLYRRSGAAECDPVQLRLLRFSECP